MRVRDTSEIEPKNTVLPVHPKATFQQWVLSIVKSCMVLSKLYAFEDFPVFIRLSLKVAVLSVPILVIGKDCHFLTATVVISLWKPKFSNLSFSDCSSTSSRTYSESVITSIIETECWFMSRCNLKHAIWSTRCTILSSTNVSFSLYGSPAQYKLEAWQYSITLLARHTA